jgi:hypothetical protein
VPDAGAVFLIPGTAQGLTGAGAVVLTEAAPRLPTRKPGPTPFEQPELNDYFGEANAILNLDGTGPLDLVTSTSMEDPSGLIVWLTVRYSTPRRGQPAAPVPTGLVATKVAPGSAFEVFSLGHTLLHR